MKKVMGKKGQATGPLPFIIGFVILAVTAFIVIIGFTQGWDVVFGKFGVVPGELEAAAQSCGISSSQNLKTSYCDEFKELKLSGTKQYANCKYLENYADFEHFGEECDNEKVELAAMELCRTLNDEGLVNGQVCYNQDSSIAQWGISKEHLSVA